MAALFYVPTQIVIGQMALPAGASQIFFYLTGTTTKAPIYADAGLGTPLANPVKADAFGNVGTIYLDDSITYRLRIIDRLGAQIGSDVDPYVPGTFGGVFSVGVSEIGKFFSVNQDGNPILSDISMLPNGAVADTLGGSTTVAPSQAAVAQIYTGQIPWSLPDEANGDTIPASGSKLPYLSAGVLKIA